MIEELTERPRKGRGAVTNRSGRHERLTRIRVDDGWARPEDEDRRIATTVSIDSSRSVISRNDSPDVGFEQSINPYRGCEHGCVYCYARPSHAWLGLSPGLDFETRLFMKPDAPALLASELGRPGYRCRVALLGANTDSYQPIERKFRITRRILEVLSAHEHPVSIVTKSNLVLRDLDVLASMAERGLASVGVSVTTLDKALARALEPRAPGPDKRLEAIRRLSGAGVPVTVMAAPMIPFLNDAELESILEAASAAGARNAGYILVRLPHEIRELFTEWLEAHAPAKAGRVLAGIRETRGGALYVSEFGTRMKGSGPYAELLARRFHLGCKRFGLNGDRDAKFNLDTTRFRVPPRNGAQLSLL
ncbi:MAG: PA0069 family radical SAM protein [Rhodospirillales bacterium]|nr:PA0069 family radical SAM protein [Rhodospirillales bacterium]